MRRRNNGQAVERVPGAETVWLDRDDLGGYIVAEASHAVSEKPKHFDAASNDRFT